MTRRHIEAIAAAIARSKPLQAHGTYAWEKCARNIAYALAALNPSFNKARFLRDCGVGIP